MRSRRKNAIHLILLLLVPCALGQASQEDLIWSTFLGGSGDEGGNDMAVDAAGNVYVVGATRSLEFPATDEAFDTSYNDKTDAFVIRLGADGKDLDYATYLGGSGGDRGFGIAVDRSGHAFVTGFTYSEDFPVTPGAFSTEHNSSGGVYNDIFVAKLDSTGAHLFYCTYVGGSRGDGAYGIAADSSGNAYIAGDTQSTDFPVDSTAFDTTYNGSIDVFLVKLNPVGTVLEYATYIGGGSTEYCEDVAINSSGCAYLTGETISSDFPTTSGAYNESFNGDHDAFVIEMDSSGSALVFSSFLGGSSWDRATHVALDAAGCVYLTGYTNSTGFPHTSGSFDETHNGGRDVFVTQLDEVGSAVIYSTFLGGDKDDRGLCLDVDPSGCAYVTGRTTSADFPTTVGAYDTVHHGENDVFVTKLNAQGNDLLYATFLGGAGPEYGTGIARTGSGQVAVAGVTTSSDFPVTPGCFDDSYNGWEDVFVANLAISSTPVESTPTTSNRPMDHVLCQNYPNPFNPATTIEYTIARDACVRLRIYDIRGSEVVTLVDGHQVAGSYTVTWDAVDAASGVYFCLLTAGDFRTAKKMVLLK